MRRIRRLWSVRLRVALAAAAIASLALGGGVAWLRVTVYEQHMASTERLAKRCAATLRLRLLRVDGGDGDAEYYVQPLMECQLISHPAGGFEWMDMPFEIVGSDGRRLDVSQDLEPFGDRTARPGTRLPTAALPAPSASIGLNAAGEIWNAPNEARPETVRLPRVDAATTLGSGGLAGRRYQAYTRTLFLNDLALATTEIVEAEPLLAEPERYREWHGSFARDGTLLRDMDLGARFPSWRPGSQPYLVKVYVLATPFQAERAIVAVDLLMRPGLPITVLMIAGVAWTAADHALRVVERMRAQVAAISVTALYQRLAVPDSDDQLARLATTLNDTLDRLESGIHRERQFVADAAHELRNPIGGIRAMLELARDHPDRVDTTAAIAETAHETRRLQRLAEDLLLLARLESRAIATFGPVDLAALAAAQVADRGRTGTVRVTSRTPPRDAAANHLVAGSELELDRLLSNLLDNAERHAASQITVTVEPDPTDPRLLRLVVDDDGPGIPPSDRERIFDRFTRLDESRARDRGGTGLGLAIARGICLRHHGTITVAESPSGGARFTVRLPRATPQDRRSPRALGRSGASPAQSVEEASHREPRDDRHHARHER